MRFAIFKCLLVEERTVLAPGVPAMRQYFMYLSPTIRKKSGRLVGAKKRSDGSLFITVPAVCPAGVSQSRRVPVLGGRGSEQCRQWQWP